MNEVTTHITIVTKNRVSEQEMEELIRGRDVGSKEEYVDALADELEVLLTERMFGDADRVPVADVRTELEEPDE